MQSVCTIYKEVDFFFDIFCFVFGLFSESGWYMAGERGEKTREKVENNTQKLYNSNSINGN